MNISQHSDLLDSKVMVGNNTTWYPEPSVIRSLFKIIRHVINQKLLRMRIMVRVTKCNSGNLSIFLC